LTYHARAAEVADCRRAERIVRIPMGILRVARHPLRTLSMSELAMMRHSGVI